MTTTPNTPAPEPQPEGRKNRRADEDKSPQRIVLDTMPALGGLYAKAAAGTTARAATFGMRRAFKGLPLPVPGKGARAGRRSGRSNLRLPAVEIVVPAVEIKTPEHRAFCEVVGARIRAASTGEGSGTEVFSGYLHALAFPAAMVLLTRKDFPLPTVGLVHLANTVTQTETVLEGDLLQVNVRAENLRPHRAGTAVDVVAELRRSPDAPPVWVGRSVYLARGTRIHGAEDSRSTDSGTTTQSAAGDGTRPEFVPPVPTARWQLGADTGRKYAAVSGDVNPIHLSGPSAKALGMKGAIAHGMYTASRALALLDTSAPLTWEVEFATPLVLPGSAAVAVQRDGRGENLRSATVTVWNAKKRKPHATISVTR